LTNAVNYNIIEAANTKQEARNEDELQNTARKASWRNQDSFVLLLLLDQLARRSYAANRSQRNSQARKGGF